MSLPSNAGRNLIQFGIKLLIMNQIVAPCGIDCTTCEAYKATQADDWDSLARIAKEWSDDGTQYKPKDMLCDGCFGPRINGFCVTCGVRQCALGKGLKYCSNCTDYACSSLETLWESFVNHDIDEAKERLLKAKLTL